MLETFAQFILSLYIALVPNQTPPQQTDDWAIENDWTKNGEYWEYSAVSETIPAKCKAQPSQFLNFPMSLYSIQELWGDGRLVEFHNTKEKATSGFASLSFNCRQLENLKKIEFKVYSSSEFHARLKHHPYLSEIKHHTGAVSRTIYFSGFALSCFIALFGTIIFRMKFSGSFLPVFVAMCTSFALFYLTCTSGYWGFDIGLFKIHQLGVSSLNISVFFLLMIFYIQGFLPRVLYFSSSVVFLLSSVAVFFTDTIDQSQAILLLCYPLYYLNFMGAFFSVCRAALKVRNWESIVYLIIYSLASALAINDSLSIISLANTPLLFPLGLAALVLCQGYFTHNQMGRIYSERDDLEFRLEKSDREKIEILQKNAVAHSIANTVQMIAHDLKSPFAQVRAVLSLVKDGNLSPATLNGYIDSVEDSFVKVDGLFADLLSGRKAENKLERLDLSQLVNKVWQDVRSHNRFELTLNFLHQGELFVDRSKVARILENLLKNAQEATPLDCSKLWIYTEDTVINQRPYVEISVGNEGSYIEADDQKKVFSKFFTKGKDQGTGLGLAICLEFVRSHGGTISCWSDKATGTVFTFSLPKHSS